MAKPTESKRILVIDDDEALRELFDVALGKAGFVVAGAEDGLKGLAKAEAFKPHLIVLDIMMPNLGGFEVLHKLQAMGLGGVPVIVITGYSEQANEALIIREPNVVDFLKKPIQFSEIAAKIRKLLA